MIFVKCEQCGNYLGNRTGIEVDFDGHKFDFCDDDCLKTWLTWQTSSIILTNWIYSRLDDEGGIVDMDWKQANNDIKDEKALEQDLDKQRL